MIGFGYGLRQFQRGFFDRQRVKNAMSRAEHKMMNQFGRTVRSKVQKSLKYGIGVSVPGSPPTVHKSMARTRTSRSTGRTRTQAVSPLREFISYAFDTSTRSELIGPGKLNSKDANLGALEKGGSSTIMRRGIRRKVNIRARPFMVPVFDEEKKKAAGLLGNSLR